MDKYLSIIVPCYNAEPYINELLDCLDPQITDEVEVLVIDDGSDKPFKTKYKWATVIRKDNGGASSARNLGIDSASGMYIAFIDADDLVSDKYVECIINKAKTEKFDYCYLSWKTMSDGWQQEVKLNSIEDKFPPFNLCVWNRIYKRSVIGNVRFNTKKLIAEDAEFIRAVDEHNKKKSFISEFMYFYRSSTPNSLTKRFHEGELDTRRVVYYFPKVTKQMTFLIQEFKELDKNAEIILLTNQNDLPQLESYAMVMKPVRICGTELRGYPTKLFSKVYIPIKADVCIWTERTFKIGGIETFIFNFCKNMSKYYNIVVLYNEIDIEQLNRIREYARVEKLDPNRVIDCNTLIVNRITDVAPRNVKFKKKVQMVHTCKMVDSWTVPQDNDVQVAVSNAVVDSFGDQFKKNHLVINNLTNPSKKDKALLLVSATRLGTFEKGQRRMVALAKHLKALNIPFVWLCFSDKVLPNAEGISFMKPTLNIAPYIKSADYLIQLSSEESFCYSIVEALEMGTPVLTTDLKVLPEIGFEDHKNGYILPFDVDENFDYKIIYEKPLKGHFEYKYDNQKRIRQWKKILGKGIPSEKTEVKKEVPVKLKALITFDDAIRKERVFKNDIIERDSTRAYELLQKKFVELYLD